MAAQTPPDAPQGRRKRRSVRARIEALITGLLAALGLAACAPEDAAVNLDVALRFDPPPTVGETTCTVSLVGPEGRPIQDATVSLEGNMNHAGMVPVFADAAEAAPGEYEAPFEFTMGGDWFVIVRAELSDGREVEEILDVPAVPPRRKAGERTTPSE